MRIGVDLDGVTADIGPELLYRLSLEGIDVSAGFRQFKIEEQFNVRKGWIGEQFADPTFFLNAKPFEDAWTMINKWFSKGHDIFFITCRWESNRPETERWLDEWDLPYNELVMQCTHGEKWLAMEDREIPVLIEDRDSEVKATLDAGYSAIMMNRSWNEHVSGAYVVDNFYQIDNEMILEQIDGAL